MESPAESNSETAWDVSEQHLHWEYYERRVANAIQCGKGIPPAPHGYPGFGWRHRSGSHPPVTPPYMACDGPAPFAPLTAPPVNGGYPNTMRDGFSASKPYQTIFHSPESIHTTAYSQGYASTSSPSTLEWGPRSTMPNTPASMASDTTMVESFTDLLVDSEEATVQVAATQAMESVEDGIDNTQEGSTPNKASLKTGKQPVPIEDIPDWFPEALPRSKQETAKAPKAIIREAKFLLLEADDLEVLPMFEVPAEHPHDRYGRPLFFTLEKKNPVWRLWYKLSPAVQLAYRMGCPPPGNRSEIVRRRKMISNKLMLTHKITLNHPMRYYHDHSLTEGVIRPCVHTIWKLMGTDYGWDKQLCLDVMTSICNDNHHNLLQLDRIRESDAKGDDGEPALRSKGKRVLQMSSEPPPASSGSPSSVKTLGKRKTKGPEPSESPDSLEDVDDTRRPPKRWARASSNAPPITLEAQEDITEYHKPEEAPQLDDSYVEQTQSNSTESQIEQYTSQGAFTEPEPETPGQTFIIQVFGGEKLQFDMNGSYRGFLTYMKKHIEFPPDVDAMWYRNPNDKEWAPLGYNAEWEGVLRAARKGIVEVKLDSQKEWPDSETETAPTSAQFLPKISRLPQGDAPPAVKKPITKATPAKRKPAAKKTNTKPASKASTPLDGVDIVKETPIKRRPGRPKKTLPISTTQVLDYESNDGASDASEQDTEAEDPQADGDTQHTQRRSNRVSKPSKAHEDSQKSRVARSTAALKQKTLKDAKKLQERQTASKRPAIEAE